MTRSPRKGADLRTRHPRRPPGPPCDAGNLTPRAGKGQLRRLPVLMSLLSDDDRLPHLLGLRAERPVNRYGVVVLAVLAGDGGIRGAKNVTAATARRRNFKSPVRPVLAVKRSVLTENRTKNAYGRPGADGLRAAGVAGRC